MGNRTGNSAPASERGRRPSGDAGAPGPRSQGRWGARRKLEVVLRILRGESLDLLSRQLGVTAARLSQWRDQALMGFQAALKSRPSDARDEEVTKLRAKIGEITMENELLYDKIHRMEEGLTPPSGRPRR